MGITERLGQQRGEILRLADVHGADRVCVFGSLARGDARADSDVDFLVHTKSGSSLFDLIGLEQDLKAALGCEVDVLSEGGVSPYLRDDIFKEAVPL